MGEKIDARIKELWDKFIKATGRNEEDVKKLNEKDLDAEMDKRGFTGFDASDIRDYWKTLQAPNDRLSGGAENTVSREYFDQQIQLLEIRLQQQQNLNVWKETIDSGSSRHRGQFADRARKFYGREFNKIAYCMLTGLPGAVVGHLWPHSKIDDPRVKSLNIVRDNLEGPRNAIVVLKSIEEAFDRGRLCLVWHAFNKQFIVVILDPTLKDEFVVGGQTFASIEGSYLRHPAGKIPFLRVLGVHASESYSEALVNGWITQETYDTFKDFGTLSPIEKQAVVAHQSLSERYPVFGDEYTITIGDELMVLVYRKEYKAKVVRCTSPTSYLVEYKPGDTTRAGVEFISKLPLLHNN